MSEICFIEAQPRVVATGATTPVRLAGGGTDTPYYRGGEHYHAGVVAMPRFKAAFGFDENGWTGGTVPTSGELGFMPGQSDLMALLAELYWREAVITVDAGDERTALSRRLTGTVAGVAFNEGQMALTIADPSKALDKPILGTGFAGTGGIEGAAEAAGRPKRRSWGRVYNVELRLLDKVNNIYEAGDPAYPLQAFDDVRDKGRSGPRALIEWQGSIEATFAALQAAVPEDGGCVVAPSIACVKWWTVPAGPLTADLRGEIGDAYVERAVPIAARLLSIAAAPPIVDEAAADALRPAACGIHVAEEGDTFAQAIDRLLLGCSLFWILQPEGNVRVGEWRWTAPEETLQAIFIGRERQLPPIKSRKVGYRRNHRPQRTSEISATLLQASDVVYPDGTPIDVLQPAEPGATEGAPAGTPVNDRTAEQITAQIDSAHEQITDLFDTYGSTASAAASADAAEQFKILAEAAKDGAEAAEVQSLNSANNSQGSADASAQSAALADTKAGEAGASATAAEGFMLSARRSAAKVLPSQVGDWDDFVVHTGGSFGAPVEDSPSPDWGSTITAAGEGEVREFVGTRYIFVTRGKLPRGTGRKFKFTARFRTTVDANPNGIYLGFFQYNEDDSYVTTTNWSYKGQSNSADGWTEITATIESAEFSSPYIRAGMAVNSANGTGSSGATMQVASLRFEDITESDRAASSATAAQASAVSADADAALASQQAGLAATHKNESEAAATAASGSAASANADAAAAATNAEISAAYSATRGLTPNGDLSQGNTGWDGGAGEPDGAGPAATFTPVASWNGATNVLVNSSNTRKNIRARAHQVLPDRKYRVHWRYRVTATCGNYVYIRGYDAAGTYITTFQAHGTASPPLNTWIEGSYDFDSSNLAGWAMFAISFNSNTANLAATVGVDYLYLEDITESAAASSFADIAESQQVIATAAAAAAQTNAQLSAQLASQGYFGNANFAQWSGSINSIPDGFVNWAGSYTIERRSGGRYGSPSYMLMDGGSGMTATGILRSIDTGLYNQPFGPNQWVVIEVDARLRGGDLRGSGILFRSGGSTSIDAKLDLYTDPDTTGATGNGISSQGLRSWRKLVQMPGFDANNTKLYLYIMNKWGSFPSSNSSSAATQIDWYYVNVRPATDGEIKAQQVDGLSATVTQHATALATHDTQLASIEDTVQAQGVTVSQHTTAINNVEDDVSNMAGRWAVQIDANGRVVGRVRLDGTQNTSSFEVTANVFKVVNPSGGAGMTWTTDANGRPTLTVDDGSGSTVEIGYLA